MQLIFSYSNFSLLVIVLLASSSFINIATQTPVSSNIIFHFILLCLATLIHKRKTISKEVIPYTVILSSFLIYSTTRFFVEDSEAKIKDFVQMYKSLFYLLFLCFFCGKSFFSISFLNKFFNYLLIIFLIKYVLVYIFFNGLDTRPVVFYENNFELFLLLIPYIKIVSHNPKVLKRHLIALTIIFFTSRSRSALAAFLVVVLFLDFGPSRKVLFAKFTFLLLAVAGSIIVFIQRMGNLTVDQIDRVKFFACFLRETKEWNLLNYLFGANFMTPMGPETSQVLSFYKPLYSNHDTLHTYSVVLHSYLMRIVFDFGLIGLFFVYILLYKILKLGKLKTKEIFLIIIITVFNGLSVSSLNSIYIIFPILLITITYSQSRVCVRKLRL